MGFRSASAKEKRIRSVCEKFAIFPYGQYINGIDIKCGFKNVLCCEIEAGIYEKFAKKCNSDFRK